MSVHSIDGNNTWSTKLNRIGELSANKPEIIFNNIGHILDFNMLRELYYNLDGNKAVGIDKVTKDMYGESLTENLTYLLHRLRRGIYKPKPARITEIPKEDGSFRPLAISCLEDKLVQLAVSKILTVIYEPRFSDDSFGFRSGKSCHDALRKLSQLAMKNRCGAIVEIDIKQYFNRIPHNQLIALLKETISDKRFLKLISTLIKTPSIKGGKKVKNDIGCPQGSIISPILANIYLDRVIDQWFDAIRKPHLRGRANMVRYADDLVFTFEHMDDAQRFYRVLPKRLERFGLTLHIDKSSILPAGHYHALQAKSENRKLPTFNFLGFTCYWGRTRSGYWVLKFISRRDRFVTKLKGLKRFLRKNMTTCHTLQLLKKVSQIVKGWISYHFVVYNKRRVSSFIQLGRCYIRKWLNRRGRKKPLNWNKAALLLKLCGYPEIQHFQPVKTF